MVGGPPAAAAAPALAPVGPPTVSAPDGPEDGTGPGGTGPGVPA